MLIDQTVLRREEAASLQLRTLYSSYGYTQFKMSKFEEYELYVRNKDFLSAERVITFTDTDGALLALKPDVTLSIIKNSRDVAGVTHKICYNENVYRISDNTHAWREIPQVGLECLGVIDLYQKSEVLTLAAMSLALLDDSYLLDVSHMGMLSGALESVAEDTALRDRLACAVSEKNADAVRKECEQGCIDAATAQMLIELLSCDGMFSDVLPRLRALCINDTMRAAACELKALYDALQESPQLTAHMRLDFSVVNNRSYYSGLLFQGFIPGVPRAVLFGGQYDRLMRKMGRSGDAIGFAVYPDLLQLLPLAQPPRHDADVLLLYRETDAPALVHRAVRTLTEQGKRVRCATAISDKITCREVLHIKDWEESLS